MKKKNKVANGLVQDEQRVSDVSIECIPENPTNSTPRKVTVDIMNKKEKDVASWEADLRRREQEINTREEAAAGVSTSREACLSDEEFEIVMGMTREEFHGQPKWKRELQKKKKKSVIDVVLNWKPFINGLSVDDQEQAFDISPNHSFSPSESQPCQSEQSSKNLSVSPSESKPLKKKKKKKYRGLRKLLGKKRISDIKSTVIRSNDSDLHREKLVTNAIEYCNRSFQEKCQEKLEYDENKTRRIISIEND